MLRWLRGLPWVTEPPREPLAVLTTDFFLFHEITKRYKICKGEPESPHAHCTQGFTRVVTTPQGQPLALFKSSTSHEILIHQIESQKLVFILKVSDYRGTLQECISWDQLILCLIANIESKEQSQKRYMVSGSLCPLRCELFSKFCNKGAAAPQGTRTNIWEGVRAL